MKKMNFCKSRLIASLLTVCFLTHQSFMLNAFATNITGVTGNNGVYNINPSDIKGNIGFREYQNFNLSEGDIANLIFKHGSSNLAKFVNLVDGKININGIVNTMRDGNFYNGQAIFVSPQGMVVGASGVLNVGSLAVYTPTSADYKDYKANYMTKDLSAIQTGKADVTINGKVLSRGGVEILGKKASLGANSQIMSGVKDSTAFNSASQANALFEQLVNTSVTNANKFASENGKIVIKSDSVVGEINTSGTIKNFGKGQITFTNSGSKGTTLGGTIENANGNVIVNNNGGLLNVTGKVSANGNISMTNNGVSGMQIKGDIETQKGNILLVNNKNKMSVLGNITNENGATTLKNTASDMKISGNIKNNGGNLLVTNTGRSLEIQEGAKLSNNGTIRLLNSGNFGLTVNGEIENAKSTVLTNKAGKLTVNGKLNTEGALNLNSSGSGMEITENGAINHKGAVFVQNFGQNGATINGKIANEGNTTILNYAGSLDVNNGTIENANGKLALTNKGDGAMNVGANGVIFNNNGTTTILNYGENGTSIDGSVLTDGNTTIINKANNLEVNGRVYTKNGNLKLSNSGYGVIIGEDGYIGAEHGDVSVQNFGENGITHNGQISSFHTYDEDFNILAQSGNTTVTNTKGDMRINGAITSDNKVTVKNTGDNIRLTGYVLGDKAEMTNTGSNGLIIDGGGVSGFSSVHVNNKAGQLKMENALFLTNPDDGVEIQTVINNEGTGLYIDKDSYIAADKLLIKNSGSDGMELNGNFDTNKFTAINNDGSLYIDGQINNKSDSVVLSNYGTGLTVGAKAQINNDKNIRFVNNGEDGMKINGKVTSTEDVVQFINNKGELQINGEVADINKPTDAEEIQ